VWETKQTPGQQPLFPAATHGAQQFFLLVGHVRLQIFLVSKFPFGISAMFDSVAGYQSLLIRRNQSKNMKFSMTLLVNYSNYLLSFIHHQ
jgi:hypothetical protein